MFATTIIKIVQVILTGTAYFLWQLIVTHGLLPHVCNALSKKLDWSFIFAAMSSCDSIVICLNILVYLKGLISLLQSIGMSAHMCSMWSAGDRLLTFHTQSVSFTTFLAYYSINVFNYIILLVNNKLYSYRFCIIYLDPLS